ncbi:MAG: DUF1634 domain-containing protein [Gemmatimonadales bacterium]
MVRPAASDHEVEVRLGRLLRVGVLSAASLVLAGGVLYLAKYGTTHTHHATFTGEPDDLRRVDGIVKAALALRGRGLIQLGLLLLIATPVARVAFSLYAFARQRDRTYIALTAFVLLLLLASLAGITS